MDHSVLTIEASLDGLLIVWRKWQQAESVGQGYPTTAPGCKLYRASRQYDDSNGALDSDMDATLGAAVDAHIEEIAQPHKTALHLDARNLVTGVSVWSSARLPIDPMARAIIVAEARGQLIRRLQSAGLM
jgi:hypothetical protein